MERESNQMEAAPIQCRTGCGFFGSTNTDGLCSKCYKDNLKKKQQPPPTAPSVTTSPPPPPPPSANTSSSPSPSSTPPTTTSPSSSSSSAAHPVAVSLGATSTALPTVPLLTQVSNSNNTVLCCGDTSPCADSNNQSITETETKKKKMKCQTCKKKVGLTGFTCRCGGLYCSVHRYSNEHRCTFDYRELGAEEIRRNNPVIKGEKIQKI